MIKPLSRLSADCVVTSAPRVRDAIARAIIEEPVTPVGRSASSTLGSITLLPHQCDAVTRVRAMLRELHVALLADDVGLGKTYVALAVARDYQHVQIIAPAALLPMWRTALARAQCTPARLESLQHFSVRRSPAVVPPPGTLVIIDEAHHLRTPSTRRYRAVAEAVVGCDLLLMSATPVHNTPGDLRALLALALGSEAARLSHGLLARVVVRRTQVTGRPSVSEQPPIAVPHNPTLLDAILSLPAPLPAHDGAVAGALIRLGLLRAWCSSDAALTRALRQRLLRGEALRHALEAGRHPTAAELRSWLVGEHEVQLAFPELLAGHAPATGSLLDVLSTHLEAVRYLLSDHLRESRGDVARADALRTIARAHPDVPVVAFSQFAATVRAIGRALSDIAGVGILTGQRAWIASGTISRRDAIAHFAPVAQGRPPPPSHQRIRLLLTTDLLAEGVNLQDAGVVVHLDLPWTDALIRQRVGRCVRVGSPHREVVVYRIDPPPGPEAVLHLFRRLERKARLGVRLIGAVGKRMIAPSLTPRRARLAMAPRGSAADDATRLRTLLMSWMTESGRRFNMGDCALPGVSAVRGAQSGFVAVIAIGDAPAALIGGSREPQTGGRERIRMSASPSHVLGLLRDTTVHPSVRSAIDASWPRVHRALQRWMAQRHIAVDLGDIELAASSAHRRAHVALSQTAARLSALQRVVMRSALQDAYSVLARARGVAAERALMAWVASRAGMSVDAWLGHWRSWTALRACVEAAAPIAPRSDHQHGVAGILAVLLIESIAPSGEPASFRACPDLPSCSISMGP